MKKTISIIVFILLVGYGWCDEYQDTPRTNEELNLEDTSFNVYVEQLEQRTYIQELEERIQIIEEEKEDE